MRERKCVKIRVDMYDGTKFKIIDMKPERDLINYIWTRLLALAGKVNLEGELYLSKNIPYTIETLAIEFNRDIDQIKLALDVFIELEMIQITEDNIYRVKNFAKHQNIKVKEKIKDKDMKNKEIQVKENLKNEIHDNGDKESENEMSRNKVENVRNDHIDNLEITHKDMNEINNISHDKINNNISKEKSNNNLQGNMPILLETKKKRKANKIKEKNSDIHVIDEDIEDQGMISFYDADNQRPLAEGESVTQEWIF